MSWGFTNGRVDQSEIYYTDGVPEYQVRKEEVKVKGGKTLTFEFYETDHGVLVSDPASGPYILIGQAQFA